MTCEVGRWTCGHWTRWTRWPLLAVVELRTSDVECLKLHVGRWDIGRWDVGTLGRWDVGTLGRWDVGRWIGRTLEVGRLDVGRWTLDIALDGLDALDVIMHTVANHAMMTHDHMCSPTNYVDNCSYIDFVIIDQVLKATIEWRVFLKMTRQVYLVVRLSAFVFLYLDTNMKSQRHSMCFSLRRCECLRVSVCPSLPVCVCLCLSPVSVFLCLSLSLSRSVSQLVGLSVCLSVCQSVFCRSVGPSVGLSVCLSRSGACREKVSACLCVCAWHPRYTHNHSIRREGAMDDHG